MFEKYRKALAKIQEADMIVIGASNGLSISEGVNIFADDAPFRKHFGDFREKYGFRSIIRGCFYPFPSQEEKWAFFSRMFDYFVSTNVASPVMKNLYELVKDKDYFIITSNIDAHFTLAGFPEERLFEIEGNCLTLQCSRGCHDQVYSGDEILREMAQCQEQGRVPTHLVPRCPQCGGPMHVHIEVDRSFLRDQSWQSSYRAYEAFIQRAHGRKVVFLELGVGARNQMIKAPFMELVRVEENATYISLNKGELYIPVAIADKSIGIDGDTAEALRELVQLKGD